MKKLLLINSVCGVGSTGRICLNIAKCYEQDGYEVRIAYGRYKNASPDSQKYSIRIGNSPDVYLHVLYTRLTDRHGLASKHSTREFLKWADKYDPDLLWIHNIHDYYINYEMLFEWIKSRPDMQVKWTLHDCWAFTGHCTHFIESGCNKWQSGCGSCPSRRDYPSSIIADNSADNYMRKKKAFTGVNNMQLITPSKWLANLTRESFLLEYPVEVMYNTVNRDVFKPSPSDIRSELVIRDDQKIILGVANPWSRKKACMILSDFRRY